MRIVHVVPHISAEASGPSYSVPRLCQAVAADGHEVTLSCLAAGREIPGVRIEVHGALSALQRFGVSPQHTLALSRHAEYADIVHNHSLWSMVNLAAGWVVPGRKARLVTSPRGTLSTWALSLSQHRKRLLWPLQKRVLSRADLLHATGEEEYLDIRRAGFRAPVAVIPNGIDMPLESPMVTTHPEARRLLFLSRVHPTKGLERLLDAWAILCAKHPEWELRIVGPGEEAYVAALKARAEGHGAKRVLFEGPLYGPDKARAYRNASLFVLPTHSENFGMAVAEALAHGCPAVVSYGAPWAGLDAEGCGWWVANDVETLTAALDRGMSSSAEALRGMGARGRSWMQRDFAWSAIGSAMESAYRWILEGGAAPSCVRLQ